MSEPVVWLELDTSISQMWPTHLGHRPRLPPPIHHPLVQARRQHSLAAVRGRQNGQLLPIGVINQQVKLLFSPGSSQEDSRRAMAARSVS